MLFGLLLLLPLCFALLLVLLLVLLPLVWRLKSGVLGWIFGLLLSLFSPFSLFGVWYLNVQESDVCHSAFLSYFISETLEHINFEVLG
jgi:hypothetical protein